MECSTRASSSRVTHASTSEPLSSPRKRRRPVRSDENANRHRCRCVEPDRASPKRIATSTAARASTFRRNPPSMSGRAPTRGSGFEDQFADEVLGDEAGSRGGDVGEWVGCCHERLDTAGDGDRGGSAKSVGVCIVNVRWWRAELSDVELHHRPGDRGVGHARPPRRSRSMMGPNSSPPTTSTTAST